MTSSLVGSEMCIRDRAYFLHRLRGATPSFPAPIQQRTTHPQFLALGQSVSYTHLTLPTICSV
eukprot:5707934-Prorocentrum_lima.AAC.1